MTPIEPDYIDDSTVMMNPNLPIPIYNGEYAIITDKKTYTLAGQINFKWFPSPSVIFEGDFIKSPSSFHELFGDSKLELNNQAIGSVNIISGSGTEELVKKANGLVLNTRIGDVTVPVDTIEFSIPNLREIRTNVLVKKEISNDSWKYASRCILHDDKYLISLDRQIDHEERRKLLNNSGGYLILYNGKIEGKGKNKLSYDNIKDLIERLGHFLSFVNGSRCSRMFFKGKFKGKEIWSVYNNHLTDPYKDLNSWLPRYHHNDIQQLWLSYSELCKSDDDKDFINNAIHWYIEANSTKLIIEGSIILSQTCLELIYNYLITEKLQIIKGKDKENISASNKIRLLLSQIKINNCIPKNFKKLNKIISENENITDGPDVIVFLRNAIVHSQLEKRKSLKKLELIAKHEALQLSLYYIELALLSILKYNGRINDRCCIDGGFDKREPYVPWNP